MKVGATCDLRKNYGSPRQGKIASLPEDLISSFVSTYRREMDHYSTAARLCHEQCEALLAARGIKAIVTSRAKGFSKLETKIRHRNKEKNYKIIEEIREDIVDLAGVRIALYFPGDRPTLNSIINENFAVKLVKSFPEPGKKRTSNRFEGYYADHLRVRLKEAGLDQSKKQYAEANIEIQVGSVLMHAWAEVNHDLVYKPESGELSEDEHAILDELNGMVIAGEVALERLQRAVERRLTVRSSAS